MASWKQVRDFILDNYTSAEYIEDDDILRLEFDVGNDRSQLILVDRAKSKSGETDWLNIMSPVGEVGKNDIFDLLEELSEYVCGGAIKINNTIWLRNRILLDSVDSDSINNVMGLMAEIADGLEEKYVGGDDN